MMSNKTDKDGEDGSSDPGAPFPQKGYEHEYRPTLDDQVRWGAVTGVSKPKPCQLQPCVQPPMQGLPTASLQVADQCMCERRAGRCLCGQTSWLRRAYGWQSASSATSTASAWKASSPAGCVLRPR